MWDPLFRRRLSLGKESLTILPQRRFPGDKSPGKGIPSDKSPGKAPDCRWRKLLMHHAGIVTDEMLTIPKWRFAVIGMLEALGVVTRMYCVGPSTPPSYSSGPSTPPSYSSGPSTPPSYCSGPSTPTNYSLGSSRNAECSNYKHLRGRISVLKEKMDMHLHPEQHIVNSAALLHEVLNEIEKQDLE
nr:protein CLT2, chloroplastic [Tanacetum cinerariifolium]